MSRRQANFSRPFYGEVLYTYSSCDTEVDTSSGHFCSLKCWYLLNKHKQYTFVLLQTKHKIISIIIIFITKRQLQTAPKYAQALTDKVAILLPKEVHAY